MYNVQCTMYNVGVGFADGFKVGATCGRPQFQSKAFLVKRLPLRGSCQRMLTEGGACEAGVF